MSEKIRSISIIKVKNDHLESTPDLLAVEEPLEIRLGYGPPDNREQKSLSVTMRTPGNDFELALGFLFTESIIKTYDEVENIKYCEDVGRQDEKGNVLRVELKPTLSIDFRKLQRHFYTSSSCGVCGKSSLEAVSVNCARISSNLTVSTDIIRAAPEKLRKAQAVFVHTGGLHATGLFDLNGELVMLREDVGRHNALDKVVGACLLKGLLPLDNGFLLVSGRTSFELVQKAVMSGIPLMAAVGAPSSLAVDLANEFNMTLAGFVRNGGFNIYSGHQRIKQEIV